MKPVFCETCAFFRPERSQGFTGRCRARPPVPVFMPESDGKPKVRSMWPIVRSDDWCGEHALDVKDEAA